MLDVLPDARAGDVPRTRFIFDLGILTPANLVDDRRRINHCDPFTPGPDGVARYYVMGEHSEPKPPCRSLLELRPLHSLLFAGVRS